MPDSDWERLQRLFDKAMALPEAERAAFLDRACGNDESLRRNIDALIEADAQNEESNQDPSILQKISSVNSRMIGTIVDGWRILDHIGTGGMGKVYRAERADGEIEQRVALKIVKRGMDSEIVLRRFRQERQILARLNHPNIAGFLDGGMTEDGRPYFAMELVEGLPITEYCDLHRLTLEKRLELFRKACDAVHYAHKSLVVHRDLKPSNIIVTADGNLKLLDFGIAKLLDESDADDRMTRTGMQVLTPAYAAPEQLMNSDITTATDVYALGIVLYELLTGRRPFGVRRTPAELRELVLTGNPLKPSAAVLQIPADTGGNVGTQTIEELSAVRGARTERLRKLLAGDLDTICLMAMHREPDHRYSSADQMAADISRHLEGLPVVASPDSVWYRVGKFYKRHRAAVISTAGVIIAFTAMSVFYTLRLAEERDFALQEQEKANEVVDFVVGLFEVSDPSESRGEEVTARDLLDAGAERIQTELGDRPAIQSMMRRVLGEVYYNLGSNELAGELISTALEQQIAIYGDHNLEVATSKLLRAFLHQDVGEYDDAEPLYREALETRRALLGSDHPDVMEALSALAFFEEMRGDYREAERLHVQTLDMGRRIFSGDDEFLAEAITNLAGLYRILDRPDEAEPLLREALAMQDRLYGGPHPEIDDTKRQIAGLLRDTRQFAESEAIYKEVIASRAKMLGDDHIELAHVWNSYSQLLSDMEEYDAALDSNTRFVEIMERAYNGPHPSLGAAYHNRATFLIDAGDSDGAIEHFRKSIAMQDAVGLPPRHPNRAYPLGGIAGVHLDQQRFDEAESVYRDVLALRSENYPDDHVLILETKSSLGAALAGLGKFAEAEALQKETYERLLADRGASDPRTRRAVRRLVELYEKSGNADEADRFRQLLPGDDAD